MIFPTLENVNMALSKIKEVAQSHNGELLLIEVLIINSEKFTRIKTNEYNSDMNSIF